MPAPDRNAGGPGAMPMPDDLPRTLRREREARERSGLAGLPHAGQPSMAHAYAPDAPHADGLVVAGTTVTDVRIPFSRLVVICLKVVLAAVPAMILLGAILWVAGHLLMTFFPWLVKLQILIRVP